MKFRYLIYLFNFIALAAYGQNDYYSTALTTKSGIKLFDDSEIENANFCQVIVGGEITKYTPDEVTEYGFKDGRVFQSFPIKLEEKTSRYFLERIIVGKTKIYYLRLKGGIMRFYLPSDNDSVLVQIPPQKEKYRRVLDSLVRDCPPARKRASTLTINKTGLINFLKKYDRCEEFVLPRFRFGIKAGVSGTRLYPTKNLSIFGSDPYNFEKEYLIGVFVDAPINLSNWSFHPEIGLKHFSTFKQGHNISKLESQNINYEMVINYSSLDIPLLFRFTQYSKNLSPYIQLGPTYSRIFQENSSLATYERNGQQLYMKINETSWMQKNMAGGQVGCGILINTNAKCSYFLEINGRKLFNQKKEDRIYNIDELNIQFGLTF